MSAKAAEPVIREAWTASPDGSIAMSRRGARRHFKLMETIDAQFPDEAQLRWFPIGRTHARLTAWTSDDQLELATEVDVLAEDAQARIVRVAEMLAVIDQPRTAAHI